jgi:hypothetical protein
MLNRSSVLLGLVAFVLATSPAIDAQQANRTTDRYSFKAGPEATTLDFVINRWSSDSERDNLFQAAQKDPARMMEALKEPGVLGWIHLPGGLDHTIRYARRVTRPDGSVDVVALAEGAVWVWWTPEGNSTAAATNKYPFTVIQFHLPKTGVGEGKLSVSNVAADRETGLVIGDYAQQRALLTDVKHDSAS